MVCLISQLWRDNSVVVPHSSMVQLLVVLFLFSVTLADFHLRVLHTNDMHARFQQTNRYCELCYDDNSTSCYGGFARLQSEVTRLKQEAEDDYRSALFLNAGDTYQGTPYFTFFKEPMASKFTNLLSTLDVMCLGNHEFDDGVGSIASFIASSKIPVVCSNLDTTQEPSLNQPNLRPSVVFVINGTKVGVIGYLTPSTTHMSSTGKLQILDEISCIRAEARKLLSQGVGILIALGHSGYYKDLDIAREVEEIDLVVGGHSHTFLYSGSPPDIEKPQGPYPTVVTQASGKQVPVVQAYYGTKYLGCLDLDFDDLGNLKVFSGSAILMSGNKTEDPNILRELKPYERNISDTIHRVIAKTDGVLDGRSCRYKECSLGDLVTDSFVYYVEKKYTNPKGWTMAAVALLNAGGIRDNIDPKHNQYHNGSIMFGDVMLAMPYSNNLVMLPLPGHELRAALEYSVQWYGNTSGYYPKTLQVSGLNVVYDVNRTMGHRVVNVTVRCADCQEPSYQPLDLSQVYNVIMSDYIAQGGSGFNMFTNYTKDLTLIGVEDYIAVSQYMEHQAVIYPTVEGRIKLVRGVLSKAVLSTCSSCLVFLLFIGFIVLS